jgi:AraC-like DNA-binding protein
MCKRPGRFLFRFFQTSLLSVRKTRALFMTTNGASAGAVTLDYATPDESLRHFLSVFYEFRAEVPVFEDVERADLAQFRFLLKGRGCYTFSDGVAMAAPVIQILGPSTGPTGVRVEGPVDMFGVGLLPAGWGALLDFEASVLVNRVIDATDVFGPGLNITLQALRDSGSFEERVAIGNAFAHEMAARDIGGASAFTHVVDQWLTSSPSPSIDELVRAAGVSRRQVERHCKKLYGSPPKLLARKYRALRAAICLAKGESCTQDLVDDGFYDQSHFIREIKHFTGLTPGKIAEDFSVLAKLTLKRTEFDELAPLITNT